MQTTLNWHLFRLEYRNGNYYTHLVESFDTLEEGVAAQRKLKSQCVDSQLSNVLPTGSHKIFDLGIGGSHA